jgi:hypothetical protein
VFILFVPRPKQQDKKKLKKNEESVRNKDGAGRQATRVKN